MEDNQTVHHLQKSKNSGSQWWQRAIVIVIPTLLLLLLFNNVIFHQEQLAFRDAGCFYYPLLERIQSYWDSGTLPLWDPNENIGQPLAGNAPSSVFYPGKLIFFLPWILPVGYPWCYKTYIIAHCLFCYFSMYLLLRYWKRSRSGSIIGAMSYAFGGPVLYQYCNVIFLVGAAWLPLAILTGDMVLRRRTIRSVLLLAIVLAMTVLGGDPQSGYFAGIMLLGLAFTYRQYGFFRTTAKPGNKQAEPPSSGKKWTLFLFGKEPYSFRRGLWFLLAAATLAGLATAFQILPSSELAKESDRRLYDTPISIWEIPGYVLRHRGIIAPSPFYPQEGVSSWSEIGRGICNGIFCADIESDGAPVGHPGRIYDMSGRPVQGLEFFWPNFNGLIFPKDTRWNVDMNCWVLSIYSGIIPVLLAISVFQIRRRKNVLQKEREPGSRYCFNPALLMRVLRRWASWLFLLALLGVLGGYGPLWLARYVTSLSNTGFDVLDFDPVGGVYWFLTVVLPGFASFRFPPKLLTLVAFALAVLATIGWDTIRHRKFLRRLVLMVLGISTLLLLFFYSRGVEFFAKESTDNVVTVLGQYSKEKAFNVVTSGVLQTVTVLAIFLFFLIFAHFYRPERGATGAECIRLGKKSLVYGTLIVLLIDLALANTPLIGSVPQSVMDSKPLYADLMKKNVQKGEVPIRYLTSGDLHPSSFAKNADISRQAEIVEWDRAILSSKHFLSTGMANLNAPGTMTNIYYAIFLDWIKCNQRTWQYPEQVAFLGGDYIILPPYWSKLYPSATGPVPADFPMERLHVSPDEGKMLTNGYPAGTILWKIKEQHYRVRIFHNVPDLNRPETTIALLLSRKKTDERMPGEEATITQFEPNSLTLNVSLRKPGDLVFMEQYMPGWKAEYRSKKEPDAVFQPVEVQRALQFCRLVSLPAGEYELRMWYAPDSFYRGLILGAIGWGIIATLLVVCRKSDAVRNDEYHVRSKIFYWTAPALAIVKPKNVRRKRGKTR